MSGYSYLFNIEILYFNGQAGICAKIWWKLKLLRCNISFCSHFSLIMMSYYNSIVTLLLKSIFILTNFCEISWYYKETTIKQWQAIMFDWSWTKIKNCIKISCWSYCVTLLISLLKRPFTEICSFLPVSRAFSASLIGCDR